MDETKRRREREREKIVFFCGRLRQEEIQLHENTHIELIYWDKNKRKKIDLAL
jgi:hypothetical protein